MVNRGMMLNLMPIPRVLQIFPTSRMTDDSGRRMVTGGPDVCDSQATPGVTTLVMAENHSKTKSSGVQYQAECCYEQEESSQA